MGITDRRRLLLRVTCLGLPTLVLLIPQLSWASNWLMRVATTNSAHAQSATLPGTTTPTASCPAPTTSKTIKVSWSAVTHATSYSVYQSTTSATAGFTLAASGITATSWTTATLAAATYWYQVVVVDGTKWTGANSPSTSQATIHATGTLCTMP